MKSFLFFLAVFIGFSVHAQEVSQIDAFKVASVFVEANSPGHLVIVKPLETKKPVNDIWFFDLSPVGYIAIAPDMRLKPIIAYSYSDNQDNEGRLKSVLNYDMQLRMEQMDLLPVNIQKKNSTDWQKLLSGNYSFTKNTVYPPAGSTPTGGWLMEDWTQNAPYNNMVPMDPVNMARSVAGCPAVAMAMIVNYQESINNTVFTDLDDYYHSYAGRQYWIDDDYLAQDFPSFPQLNLFLDTLVMHWNAQQSLTNNDKAALVFACGVACTQVFTSSVSGTFGVSQALDAYYRFNFNTIEILYSGDTTIHTRLMQNMIDSLPAHLALVDSAGTVGHNIVVDGYDTDGYFHVNFGWGGTANGWYDLPAGFPYQLTVIEGVIVDIEKNITTGLGQVYYEEVLVYPNPAANYFQLSIPIQTAMDIKIYDTNGNLVKKYRGNEQEIDISDYASGIYYIDVYFNNKILKGKFIKE